ncbi:MAG: hypothetical protein ABID09_05670 [Candidatus Omnitrophota bacterium]
MSIIAEALKKAQRESSGVKKPRMRVNVQEPIAIKKKSVFRFITLAVSVLLLLILAGISFYRLNQNSALIRSKLSFLVREIPSTDDESKETRGSRRAERKDEPVRGTVPTPKNVDPIDKTDLPLDLNGIMYTPNMPLVILNGRVLAKDNTIEGYTVSEIGKDFVKLKLGNEEFELRLGR